MNLTASFGLWLVLPLALVADPPMDKNPAGGKPFVTEAWVKDGAVTILQPITVLVPESRTEQRRGADGKIMPVTVVVMVPVIKQVEVMLDPKKMEVKTMDGKSVDAAEVSKRLKQKTKVVVSPDGAAVDDAFLKANKDASLIVRIQSNK